MRNEAMEELDIKGIWKSAAHNASNEKKYSLAEIQSYRTKKSKQIHRSSKAGILFDIIYKAIACVEYVYLLLVLEYQYPYQIIIPIIIAGVCLLIAVELGFLKKLNQIDDSDSIIDNLRNQYKYLKSTYRKFILVSSLSNPVFITGAFFLYFYFKYNEIRMESPLIDPVLYIFIVISFLIPLAAQYPVYKNQLRDLKESIDDLNDGETASEIISDSENRRKIIIIISSVLIIAGILIFLILFLSK
jgi:hypothetical protein